MWPGRGGPRRCRDPARPGPRARAAVRPGGGHLARDGTDAAGLQHSRCTAGPAAVRTEELLEPAPRRRGAARSHARRPSCRRSWPRSSASAAPASGRGSGRAPAARRSTGSAPTSARVRVRLDRAAIHGGRALQRALASVPIPRDARPATGSDHHMTIVQASTDTLWELFGAHRNAGRLARALGRGDPARVDQPRLLHGVRVAGRDAQLGRHRQQPADRRRHDPARRAQARTHRPRAGHQPAGAARGRLLVAGATHRRHRPGDRAARGSAAAPGPHGGRRLPGPAQGDPDDRAGGPALRPRRTRPDPPRDLALRRGPARVGQRSPTARTSKAARRASCSRRSHGIACRSCRCTCARGPRADVADRATRVQAASSITQVGPTRARQRASTKRRARPRARLVAPLLAHPPTRNRRLLRLWPRLRQRRHDVGADLGRPVGAPAPAHVHGRHSDPASAREHRDDRCSSPLGATVPSPPGT